MAFQELIVKAAAYVEGVMSECDASHDFEHIKRVIGGAHTIYNRILETNPDSKLDLNIITLGALLHDIGDHKYLEAGEDGTVMVLNLLLAFGADAPLARKIQKIVNGVSFTNEIKHAAEIKELVVEIPELAVVQDADRLDAIGAIGIGRLFTFGGAVKQAPMQASMDLLGLKLFKVNSYIKTEPGREMAKVGIERLKLFNAWWEEEVKMGDVQWMPLPSEVGGALDAKVAFDVTAAAIEKATSNKKAELAKQFTVVEEKPKVKENVEPKTPPAKQAAVIEAKSETRKRVTPLTKHANIPEPKENVEPKTPPAKQATVIEAKSETRKKVTPLAKHINILEPKSEGKQNQIIDTNRSLSAQFVALKLKSKGKENIDPMA